VVGVTSSGCRVSLFVLPCGRLSWLLDRLWAHANRVAPRFKHRLIVKRPLKQCQWKSTNKSHGRPHHWTDRGEVNSWVQGMATCYLAPLPTTCVVWWLGTRDSNVAASILSGFAVQLRIFYWYRFVPNTVRIQSTFSLICSPPFFPLSANSLLPSPPWNAPSLKSTETRGLDLEWNLGRSFSQLCFWCVLSFLEV